MRKVLTERCEYCNRLVKYIEPNSFHGGYCVSCLKLSRAEDLEALHNIEKRRTEDKP
jgi:late competence protein required for DNA uptake (superfamily II DNA/RNA helicase)